MKTIELTLPTSVKDLPLYDNYQALLESLTEILDKLKTNFSHSLEVTSERTKDMYSSLGNIDFTRRASHEGRESRRSFNFSKFTQWRPSKKFVKSVIYGVVFVVLVVVARNVLGTSATSTSDQRVEIEGPKAQTEINKEFSFPLTDENGDVVSEYKYVIESAELRNEILVQGVPAHAINDRTFLIINLKLVNEYNQAIEVNASDFVRLSINGNDNELLAPDIHSDPVRVQAISTKSTRIGFPISDFDTNLLLQVGEINGDKEIVEINL